MPRKGDLATTCRVCGAVRDIDPKYRLAFCRTHFNEYMNRYKIAARAKRLAARGPTPHQQAIQRRKDERALRVARRDVLGALRRVLEARCLAERGIKWESLKVREAEAVEYRERYRSDEQFRAKERRRRLIAKWSNPEREARLQPGTRWERIAALSDGSVTAEALASMLGPAAACHYCGASFDWATKRTTPSIDHVVPISANGPHALSNVVVACLPCNEAKGDGPAAAMLARRAS